MKQPPTQTGQGNLPLPLASLVGRAEAKAEVLRLLGTARLLTLTGPGGVGKTRLALEVAFAALPRFEDGAWWVELGPLCDADLVAHEVALTLGLPEDPHLRREASLGQHLASKHLLLVLDNCEHLVASCADLAGHLLRTCPELQILATSREPLGVGGEVVWNVPPLSLPETDRPLSLEQLTQSEACQLFLERARAVQPALAMTEETARGVAEVCRRLDGIALAIELAAARARVLSVHQIAAHLDDRYRLLTGGSRTDLPRHQTLQATMDWSYDLLTEREQSLFRWLSVFSGGFTLEAAQAVASDPEGSEGIPKADVLDLLSGLVLKSLVFMTERGAVRYQMLETIRQYAWERLVAADEVEPIRRRHLTYFLELARGAESRLMAEEQLEALRLFRVEDDNLRAALAWSQESAASELGLELAAILGAFWLRAGSLSEGSHWLERALAACRQVGHARIKALYQAGRLAQQRGDFERALAHARQSLALSRRLHDRQGIARALGLMGWVLHWQGERNRAGAQLERALTAALECGDRRTIARTQLWLGDLRSRQGAQAEATALLEESLAAYQQMGDTWSMAWAHSGLGEVARRLGDYQRARAHFQLSLSLYQELDSKAEIPFPLEALALTIADEGQYGRAARLWGAASSVRDSVHANLPPSYQVDYEVCLEEVRRALGTEAYSVAWAEGRALTLEQALELATTTAGPAPLSSQEPGLPAAPVRGRVGQYGLTPREVDVVRLVAKGLTDAQIAERLVISPRTVGKHLQSIYSKLYLPSRSAATRWAMEHHLE